MNASKPEIRLAISTAVYMRKIYAILLFSILSFPLFAQKTVSIPLSVLQDKIKGGWAGQTIGVTFGGPYEFRYEGTFIGDYQPLNWTKDYLKKNMVDNPGLYDDLYMDLTFVDIFEKYGLDAPVDSFANAYAHAGYMLWHANQSGRFNILNGIKAPFSGQWQNNPHADCIDYQIESDFAGLMSPGLPNAASAISNKIGHIMNYGDGWYGGVFVGAMYSLAFTTKDINDIVNEALKTIPKQSEFYQCIKDVIYWSNKYPDDWKQTWFQVQEHWANDVGCPDGVFMPFNIDAKVNAAYVVIGLLYGGGDFTKTLEITTRCGQDADCNPSTAGGILGVVMGYDKIPEYWKMGLSDIEDLNFKYTTMSLNSVYKIGYKHALENARRNGATVKGNNIQIPVQQPVAVSFEKSFPDLYPVAKIPVTFSANKDEISFEFEGTGFVLLGDASAWGSNSDYVFNTELFIDRQFVSAGKLPVSFTTRSNELCWKYQLAKGKHRVILRIVNPTREHELRVGDAIIYSDKQVFGPDANNQPTIKVDSPN
jgi:hypothetical protein